MWVAVSVTDSSELREAPARLALRCLAHPMSIGAILLLLVNDHLLKESYPGWLTGKVSDFAGLLFFPFLLGWIFGLVSQSRRAIPLAFWITGLWFTAIKTSPYAASATERLASSLGGIDSQIVVDPTDLVGLAALAVGWRLWRRIAAADPAAPIVNRRAVLVVAALASMATSEYEPPAVIDLVEDGQLHAVVQRGFEDEGYDFYTTPDGGATWTQTDATFVIPTGSDRLANGLMVRCEPGNTAACVAKQLNWTYEASGDGGITWSAADADEALALFAGARYMILSELACDNGECFRRVLDSGGRYEVSRDLGATWLAETEAPAMTLDFIRNARCDVEDRSNCSRRQTSSASYSRSADGGITWLPYETADSMPPDLWRDDSSRDQWEAVDLLCVADDECYRIFDPVGEDGPRLESSTDGGRSWAGSWTPSPRFHSDRAPWPRALAVDSTSGNLVVGVGYRGAVVRAGDGTWRQQAVGQANRPTPPFFSLSGRLWFSWIAWALVVITAARFWVRAGLEGSEPRGRPTMLIGSAVLATVGVLLVGLATQHYPYGITVGPRLLRGLVSGAVYVGFPVASIAAGLWWARRNLRRARIARIAVSSIGLVLLLTVVSAVLNETLLFQR